MPEGKPKRAAPKRSAAQSRKQTRKDGPVTADRRAKAREEAKSLPKAEAGRKMKGARLDAASQNQRDSLMIARLAQDWTWEAIAAEAGLTVGGAKRAVKVRQESAPLRLNMDPVAIIEHIGNGLALSIGDMEAVASAAMEQNNLAAAVGAKRAANDAREKYLALLQVTGRLPQELRALRHLIQLRTVSVRMIDAVDAFERRAMMALADGSPDEVAAAVRDVRGTFFDLLGVEESVDGEATDVPVLPEGADAGAQ